MRRRIRMFAAAVVFVASAPTIRGVGAVASVTAAVSARVPTPCIWHVVPTPDRNPRHMDNFLRDVAVVSADDVWAIGEAYVPEEGGRGRSLILRWDGSYWKAVRHPQRRDDGLLAVAGSSPSDVWIVGLARRPQGLVMHWDGRGWRRVQAVDPDTRFWRFTDVTAVGPDNVWVVGGGVDNGIGSTLIEHWNGARWTIVPSPNPPPSAGQATTAYLTSVVASSPSDVWAAGSWSVGCPSAACIGGALHTLIERWDGTSWRIVSSLDAPTTARTVDYLVSVSAAGPTAAWVVGLITRGVGFGGASDRALIERWDGSSWTVVPGADRSGTSRLSWRKDLMPVISGWLSGVTVGPSGEMWAVGETGRRDQRTLALRCWST